MSLPAAVLDALRDAVGPAHVLTDPDATGGYAIDWTGRFRGRTPAVVRPADSDEVARVLAACNEARVPVVPQGGNTGLVGGSVPGAGEVVVSLRRLDRIESVDPRAAQLTAGAGATIAAVQRAASGAGFRYAVDLGAREVATVGGTIATNAGGLHVLRYGPTRRQVVGIEAVLADGRTIRRLEGLEKDNTGYDLVSLLCGSEGTLAVVTAARLRVVPRLACTVTALVAFDSVAEAVDAVGTCRRDLDSLHAVELFLGDGLQLVCEHLALPRPFPDRHHAYLLVECAAATDPSEQLGDVVASLATARAVAVAVDDARRRNLWRYREGHTEAINQLGAPHKFDVTLPADRLAPFVDSIGDVVRAVVPEARVWVFGHAGDGNVHVNVTGVAPDDDAPAEAVLTAVARAGGSISAEHGIGVAKRRWLPLTRSATELELFRALKQAFDPRGILNPRVLVPPEP
jgi:FAD/FMN-containing dehydrogenase